jgi:DNA-binding NtrC family response regulator
MAIQNTQGIISPMNLTGKRLLIVDDEPLFLQTTCQLLQKEGAHCLTAIDAPTALERLENNEFDLILTDLNMPGNLRWELLQAGRQRWAHVPMIVITGVPSLPSAIESLRLGVTDYLLKPVAFPELISSIQRTLAASTITTRPDAIATQPVTDIIIGKSSAMQGILSMINRIAESNSHVLISGETGTGKELVARVIHDRSRNVGGLFQIVDCNTVVEDQLALDLFGSMDQDQVKPGLLERANGGSIFLDEVAELPLSLQPKLLRVVQNQEFTPLGSSVSQPINVRFISSTQRKMEEETAAGRFRNDLYYRLGVLSITLPPLRDRGEDVILLAEHFLKEANNPSLSLSTNAEKALLAYSWPGNVRELRNSLTRAAMFAKTNVIELEDLPVEVTRATLPPEELSDPTDSSLQEKRFELERAYLLRLLEDSKGNVTHASQKANMSRQGFHKLLRRHQISASDYRNS